MAMGACLAAWHATTEAGTHPLPLPQRSFLEGGGSVELALAYVIDSACHMHGDMEHEDQGEGIRQH
jgi:hypothetical protein